jgi:hypothetical protein
MFNLWNQGYLCYGLEVVIYRYLLLRDNVFLAFYACYGGGIMLDIWHCLAYYDCFF